MTHDKHQEFFDLAAAEWDLMFTAEDLELLKHIVSKLGVEPGMDILDLGCGTGILFDILRRIVGPEGTVTGVDFSMQMALTAHRNFPFANVNVVDADVTALPFADSAFDMGIAFSAFPHFSDKRRAVGEIHRVLRNGARFFIIHLSSSRELSDMHRRIGGVVKHDVIPDEAELREMFNGSRFTDVHIEDNVGLYRAVAVNTK
jgi:ubiquinone/menaquinone biosynthesis C-methylase UbiE